jgi:ketosteroid isomerase-like protein
MDLCETIRQFHAAYSRHDLDALMAYLAPDVVIQFPTGPKPIWGRDSIRPVWAMVFSTLIPDVRQHGLTTVAHDDTAAACEFVESGTLTIPPDVAESLKLAPGGRPYRMDMASFFHRNSDGLIDRIRSCWDTGSFAEQIGIDITVIRSLQARAHAATKS